MPEQHNSLGRDCPNGEENTQIDRSPKLTTGHYPVSMSVSVTDIAHTRARTHTH